MGAHWHPTIEQIALLGTMPDKALAEKWGVTRNQVYGIRAKRGIPSYRPKKRLPLCQSITEAQVAMLGTVPDKVLAEAWGASVEQICKVRLKRGIKAHLKQKEENWKAEAISLLHDSSDRIIAKKLNVCRKTVLKFRLEQMALRQKEAKG
jgi:hypothetical protein